MQLGERVTPKKEQVVGKCVTIDGAISWAKHPAQEPQPLGSLEKTPHLRNVYIPQQFHLLWQD